MQKITAVAILIVCIFTLFEDTQGQEGMLSPPIRPASFGSANQLRKYLQALNDYYSIVGRPRFGRSVGQSFTKRLLQDAESNIDTEGFEDVEDAYGLYV